MKKLLIGAVMMMISSIVVAAPITIGNPSVTSSGNPTFNNNSNTGLERVDQINTNVPNFSLQRDITSSWNIEASENTSFTLDLSVSSNSTWLLSSIDTGNWQVSILDTANNTVLTTNSLGSSFDLTLLAGQSITAMIAGSIALGEVRTFTSTLTISDLSVSEVPLPAAVWLFGSVLLGGLAMRRKVAQKRLEAVAA